jgi:hypothetical protein
VVDVVFVGPAEMDVLDLGLPGEDVVGPAEIGVVDVGLLGAGFTR